MIERHAELAAIVGRCRRRARLVLFLRYAAWACSLGIVSLAVIRTGWPGPILSESVLISVTGIVFGAVAALRSGPSLRTVGSHIDRHLRLDDTVTAALQAQRSTAAVAPLIVQQAVSRARQVDARAVFPIDLRVPGALFAGAALMLVFAAGTRQDSQPGGAGGRATSETAQGGGALVAARGSSGSAPQSQAPARGNSAGASSSAGPASGLPEQRDTERAPGAPGAAAREGTREPTDGSRASNAVSRGLDGTPGAERGGAGARTARAGSARDSASAPPVLAGADAKGAGGSGAGLLKGEGAGGVRSGTLLSSTQPSSFVRAPRPQQPAALFEQARRGAEAAVRRGDIPVEMRSYVREYFRAIAP